MPSQLIRSRRRSFNGFLIFVLEAAIGFTHSGRRKSYESRNGTVATGVQWRELITPASSLLCYA